MPGSSRFRRSPLWGILTNQELEQDAEENNATPTL